jgi:hypothetical protein
MAGPGDLDTSFAGNGKKAISFGGTDEARAVLVQPNAGKATVNFGVTAFGHAVALQRNGRIVVAGQRTGSDDFAVARLLG